VPEEALKSKGISVTQKVCSFRGTPLFFMLGRDRGRWPAYHRPAWPAGHYR